MRKDKVDILCIPTCIYIQVKLVIKNVILGGRVPVSKCCVKLNP